MGTLLIAILLGLIPGGRVWYPDPCRLFAYARNAWTWGDRL